MRAFTRFVLQRALWVAAAGTLLAVAGSYYTFLLYKNLHTNIEELLPSTARSVRDLQRLGARLKSVENLVVLTFCKDPAASKRFIDDLAGALGKLPQSLVAGVQYRIDGEQDFFRRRRLLFIDLDDLVKLRTFVQARILYEQDKQGLGLGLVAKPSLDFEALQRKYESQTSLFSRFPDGYYASPDQTKRALIVNLPGGAADIDAALKLKSALQSTVSALNPKAYAPDLNVRYTGNTENLIEEHAALVADLKLTTVLVIILVTAAMLLFYRAIWAPLALVLSVLMGTLWTMGVSYFLTGYLNANSAFLASIVVGNGINFGIIFLARYLEERRRGRGHPRATALAIRTTYKPTLTAALAAGISYGSLTLTDFRGFNQFGVIGLCGMLLCWISAYTLLPSFLTLLEAWRGPQQMRAISRRNIFSEGLASAIERRPRLIAGSCFAVTVAAFLICFVHRPQIMELDMNKLRDRNSMRSGSGFYYHHIADIFGKNLSPMVILPDSREDTRRTVEALRARKEREGAESKIAWVQSLDDLVPRDQGKKLEELEAFRRLLTPTVVKALPEEYRGVATEVLATAGLQIFREADLSPMILNRFTEADGTRGKIVLVDKPVIEAGQEENALVTISFVRGLREVVDAIRPNTVIAGQMPITADMVSAILTDGPKATLFAGVAVFLLVALLFRNLRLIALVSFTLWIGVIWLAGLILGFNIKINFLNFIALPITFGIGVDYGVNIFQRYREDGMRSILDTIRHTGAAVGLCSLTTVIGYGSLLLAGNQAFVSFGKIAVLGEVCCVTAAIVYLPAYLLMRQRRGTNAA